MYDEFLYSLNKKLMLYARFIKIELNPTVPIYALSTYLSYIFYTLSHFNKYFLIYFM
jgi:hypothetical protein